MTVSDHGYKRDKSGLRHYACSDCSKERPDYMIFERCGALFCETCLTKTAARKAYETWFVRDGEETTPEVREQEQMSEWQPIETAPKDGTNILLVNRRGLMAAGLWMDGVLGRGWFLRGGHEPDTFFNNHHGPTHWMQLPAPLAVIE